MRKQKHRSGRGLKSSSNLFSCLRNIRYPNVIPNHIMCSVLSKSPTSFTFIKVVCVFNKDCQYESRQMKTLKYNVFLWAMCLNSVITTVAQIQVLLPLRVLQDIWCPHGTGGYLADSLGDLFSVEQQIEAKPCIRRFYKWQQISIIWALENSKI